MEIKSYLSHFTKRNIDFSRFRRKRMAKKYGKSRFTKYPITILSEVNQYIKIMRKITCMQLPYLAIDVGSGGSTGGTCPQDFAMNKEVPFLALENTPFFLRKKCHALPSLRCFLHPCTQQNGLGILKISLTHNVSDGYSLQLFLQFLEADLASLEHS